MRRRADGHGGLRRQVAAVLVGLGGCGLACAAGAAQSEPQSCADSNAQIQALRAEVQSLRARVDRLEHGNAPEVAPAAPQAHGPAPAPTSGPSHEAGTASGLGAPLAALRRAWSSIAAGADRADVEHLLGAPARRLDIDGRTAWIYVYPDQGTGSVFFTDAGRVSSLQPPFGWGSMR